MLLNVFFFLRLWTGRAGITWRARAAFRTRSRFVPLTTPTRQPESACLRWRRTSGAAQQLRSSQGQVSFMHNHSAPSVLQRPASVAQRSRTDNWRLLRGTLNHRFLPFQQADMCHMVWKLSHHWSKPCLVIIHVKTLPLYNYPFIPVTRKLGLTRLCRWSFAKKGFTLTAVYLIFIW